MFCGSKNRVYKSKIIISDQQMELLASHNDQMISITENIDKVHQNIRIYKNKFLVLKEQYQIIELHKQVGKYTNCTESLQGELIKLQEQSKVQQIKKAFTDQQEQVSQLQIQYERQFDILQAINQFILYLKQQTTAYQEQQKEILKILEIKNFQQLLIEQLNADIIILTTNITTQQGQQIMSIENNDKASESIVVNISQQNFEIKTQYQQELKKLKLDLQQISKETQINKQQLQQLFHTYEDKDINNKYILEVQKNTFLNEEQVTLSKKREFKIILLTINNFYLQKQIMFKNCILNNNSISDIKKKINEFKLQIKAIKYGYKK